MSVTTLLGRIEEFDSSKESDWQQYVECLEHFFTANGDKKRAVFLSVIGAATEITMPQGRGGAFYCGSLIRKLFMCPFQLLLQLNHMMQTGHQWGPCC